MCGIYGLIVHRGGIPSRAAERARVFFNVLAVTAADRGTDATGIARVTRTGEVTVTKDVIASYYLIRRESWIAALEPLANADTFAMMGHTRRKTHGENIQENAHPFVFESDIGTLVGTHNGVVQNHAEFGPKEKLAVDSANLFHGLAQFAQQDWPTLLEQVQGNFALAMSRNGIFHLTRNTGSPCYVAWVPTLNCTAYASLPHMLYAATSMAGVTMTEVRGLKEGKIYSWNQRRRHPVAATFKLPAPIVVADTAITKITGPVVVTPTPTPKLLSSTTSLVSGSPPYLAPLPTLKGTGETSNNYYMCTECYEFGPPERIYVLGQNQLLCKPCADRIRTRTALQQRMSTETTLAAAMNGIAVDTN